MLFAVVGAPGAVLGPVMVHKIDRHLFEPVFGMLMLAGGLWLSVYPRAHASGSVVSDVLTVGKSTGSFNTLLGAIGVSYIAMLAMVFGLGGGVMYVPFLIHVLKFRPHVATATSQLVLAVLCLTAMVTHIALGSFVSRIDQTMYLAVGVMMGAPIGTILSSFFQGTSIFVCWHWRFFWLDCVYGFPT